MKRRTRPVWQRALGGTAFAVAVLLWLELLLAIAGYDKPLPFFIRQTDVDGQDWYVTNRQVGENWFPGDQWEGRIKVPRMELFEAAKPAGTYRIFVLGESSAYGALLDDHQTWASQLEFILDGAQQERDVQVINCGVRATTTSVYPSFLEELHEYEPDLFVLYAGHNEVYGVRGDGWLHRRRLVRLLSALVGGEGSPQRAAGENHVGIRAEFEVPPGHELEGTIPRRFRRDLDRLVDAIDDVPLMVYTVHGNEESFAPVCSATREVAAPLSGGIEDMIQQLETAPLEGGQRLCPLLEAQLEQYPLHAGLHHAVGLCKGMAGEGDAALEHYRQSIELDCLPLRARASINGELAGLASRHPDRPIAVCDLEPAFRRQSPSGAIGHRLILDHLHPSQFGSYVVAAEGARVILGNHELGLTGDSAAGAGAIPTYQEVLAGQSIGELDRYLSLKRCYAFYTHSTASGTASRERTNQLINYQQSTILAGFDEPSRTVAQELLPDSDDGHLRIARVFRARGDAERALAEARAAVLAMPASVDARLLFAELLLEGGDEQGAREQLRTVWLLEPELVVPGDLAQRLGY